MAAAYVVNKVGFKNATIDGIIQQAEISKGGFLYHFPTKNACFLALIDLILQGTLNDALKKVEHMPDTPGRVLKAYIDAWLDWQSPPYNLQIIGILEEPELKNRLVDYRIAHYELVLDKQIPDLVVQTVLLICAGLWTTPLLARATDEELAHFRGQMRDVMMDIIDRSVLPRPDA